MDLNAVPAAMRARRHWVCWRRDPERGKVPINPHTGEKAATNNPRTWGTLAEALAGLARHEDLAGVGFVFTAGDEFVGVDLDNCLEEDGTCKLWAMPIRDLFPGAYTEITPSGRGLHIITVGTLPENSRHKIPYADGHVEAYDRGRFFTMTGTPWGSAPEEISGTQESVEELVATVMGVKEPDRPATPRAAQPLALDDRSIVDAMLASRSSVGIRALWDGDTTGHGGDDSRADLALCNHLAFWTNLDAARVDRLFRQSGLYREKWEREDYRARTIGRALAGTTEGWRGPRTREERAFADEDAPANGTDWVALHEPERRGNEARRKLEVVTPKNGSHPPDLPETYTAEYLDAAEFKEPKWIIPGILCEGLCLLVGPPKGAKSALALGTAIATALGGYALAKFPVEQGEVLYLALEDIQRRMQDRMRKMLKGARAPKDLHFAHRWPKAGEQGGENLIARWIEQHERTRLVIIDTMEKFRDRRKTQGSVYGDDYSFMDRLQKVAIDCGICLLMLHHTNKRVDPADPFHAVSGSEGVSGGADTTLLLRRARGERHGKLFVTSRDVEENEYDIEFDGETMTWLYRGKAGEGPKTLEQAEVLKVVATFRVPVTPRDVHFKMVEMGSRRTQNSVKGLMWRLFQDGELILQDKGAYSLPSKH